MSLQGKFFHKQGELVVITVYIMYCFMQDLRKDRSLSWQVSVSKGLCIVPTMAARSAQGCRWKYLKSDQFVQTRADMPRWTLAYWKQFGSWWETFLELFAERVRYCTGCQREIFIGVVSNALCFLFNLTAEIRSVGRFLFLQVSTVQQQGAVWGRDAEVWHLHSWTVSVLHACNHCSDISKVLVMAMMIIVNHFHFFIQGYHYLKLECTVADQFHMHKSRQHGNGPGSSWGTKRRR